jgi:hypothetical protein
MERTQSLLDNGQKALMSTGANPANQERFNATFHDSNIGFIRSLKIPLMDCITHEEHPFRIAIDQAITL